MKTSVFLTNEQVAKLGPILDKHDELCKKAYPSFVIAQIYVIGDPGDRGAEMVVKHYDYYSFEYFVEEELMKFVKTLTPPPNPDAPPAQGDGATGDSGDKGDE